MPSASNAVANAILDCYFSGVAIVPPAQIWVGLSTADPGPDGSGIAEPAAGDYARVNVTGLFAGAAGRSALSSAEIVLSAATLAAWGPCGYGFIADAAVAGNYLWGFAGPSHTIEAGDEVKIPAAALAPSLPWS